MKRFILYLFLYILIPACLFAQSDNKPYDMVVNGVKVIVQPSGNEIVVIKTVIKGGVQNYREDKSGIETLAINALTECGTANDDKNSFKNKLDKAGAQIYGNSNMDFATFTLNVIKSDLETVWPLYIDALTKPKFDAKEFERIRQDQINMIRSMESNPDWSVDRMARKTAFAGKAYAKDPAGTVETVSKFSAEETKNYWQSLLTRSRMFVIIVGDLDKSAIETKVKELTANIPQGTPVNLKKEAYMPVANTFKPEARDNATNYIEGISGAPLPGTPEFDAFILGMRIFQDRHFLTIRSKNGLSYAPHIRASSGLSPYSVIYVTTTNPNKYIAIARAMIDSIKQNGFTADEVKNMKTEYLTNVYYNQETNEAQAASFASNEVIHGNWKRAITIKDDIKKVTVDDVNRTFRKYFNNITWVYQGDPSKVNAVMFTQKETPVLPKEAKAF